jgi:signal transduction histidine kinase
MVRLVHRLLDIGRLEAGTYPLEIESIDVRDMFDRLTRTFGVLAEEQGIRLEAVVKDTSPETIDADVDLLRNEVLGNLLSNALRFTPAGGEIRLTAWGEEEYAVFEVSDTGPGVPEDKRAHIFEKYYEGGRRRFMGAGLGLAVVKEVVEAHDGRVTLEPPDDRGATFRVYVPR